MKEKIKNKRENLNKRLGSLVKEHRLKAKMTRAELGKVVGIYPQQLKNYEDGKATMPLIFLLEFCKFLDIRETCFELMVAIFINYER